MRKGLARVLRRTANRIDPQPQFAVVMAGSLDSYREKLDSINKPRDGFHPGGIV